MRVQYGPEGLGRRVPRARHPARARAGPGTTEHQGGLGERLDQGLELRAGSSNSWGLALDPR